MVASEPVVLSSVAHVEAETRGSSSSLEEGWRNGYLLILTAVVENSNAPLEVHLDKEKELGNLSLTWGEGPSVGC